MKQTFLLFLSILIVMQGHAQSLAEVRQTMAVTDAYSMPGLSTKKKPSPKPNALMIAGGCTMLAGIILDVYGLTAVTHDYDTQTGVVSDDQLTRAHTCEAVGTVLFAGGVAMVIVGAIANHHKLHPHGVSIVRPRKHELGLAYRF